MLEELNEDWEDSLEAEGDVAYDLAIEGEETHLAIVSVTFEERLSRPYEALVEAHTAHPVLDSELIGKDVVLTVRRREEQRSLRGIIRMAMCRPAPTGWNVAVDIMPAVGLLAHTMDWRIYQDITVPELVQHLCDELLGSRRRTVRLDEVTASYPRHEYLVQHGESHLDFMFRLCDEEGIFFYFDHDAEGEDHE